MHEPAAESRIDEFLGRFTPEMQAQLRAARSTLRASFPRGFELVFDNYNALVFGISPSERASQSFISIAGYPRWATLFFLNGATLPDPGHLLEGQGKQVRSIRIVEAGRLDAPEVRALVLEAARPYEEALRAAPPLTTIVKAALARQRARRPAAPRTGENE